MIPRTRFKNGFTLIELLVVIAIIGILAALLLSALSSAKQRTIRVKCANNLKQFGLASIMYGQENRSALPVAGFDELVFPWAITRGTAGALMANGLTRDNMYDPGNQGYNNETNWSGYDKRSIGYVATFNSLMGTSLNVSINPQMIWDGSSQTWLSPPDPTKRVLVAGFVLTKYPQISTSGKYTYDYSGLPPPGPGVLSAYNSAPNPDRASHMDSKGRYPTGENVVMLDGSVKWRKFSEMEPHASGGSCFWW